jgi:type II secretory pathway pseudopilin PulG
MRPAVLLLAFLALPASAQPYTQRDRQQLEEAQREQALRAQQEYQRRIERARENCIRNRGVDCDTPEGLAEWLNLERSRAEAVLDRVIPAPSSSSGASSSQPGAR